MGKSHIRDFTSGNITVTFRGTVSSHLTLPHSLMKGTLLCILKFSPSTVFPTAF